MARGCLALMGLWLLCAAPANAAEPLRLHPENSHYFLFRGQPTLIVTSGEHYGAVLNLDFDYTRYLTTLSHEGLNGTRTWVGAYCEPYGAFGIMRNTLAPRPNRFICPWLRSGKPGYQNGGNRFDLSKWDGAYFKRLKDFVAQADKRGIIVEVNLFCPFYEESMWQFSPMNPLNNVNRFGAIERTNVYTLDKSNNLLDVEDALTRKVVTELNRFDNLYYEICNEPYFGGVTLEWQRHIGDIIVQTEKSLGRRHLISRNIANEEAKVEDPEPALSILNFHYASPPDAVALNYGLNRVIGDNETGFRGASDAPYRMEAWDFIVAGGGLFNNLDYSFTAGHEDGTFVPPASQPGGGGPVLRRQLRFLGEFMRRFNLVHLQPQPSLVVGGVPAGMTARTLGQPGQDYIIYLRTAPQKGGSGHSAAGTFADGQVVLETALPEGEFNAQWFNPKDGSLLRSEHLIAAGSPSKLSMPAFEDDVVLAIRQGVAASVAKAPAPARVAAAPPPKTEPVPAAPTTQTQPVPVPEAAPAAPAVPAAKSEQPIAPEVQEPSPSAQTVAHRPESLPLPSQEASDAAYRMRAWETILTSAPGSRRVSYATVPGGASHALRQQIHFLNEFLRRHDPSKMEPATNVVSGGLPADITPRVLRSPGQDYVIYLRRTPQAAGEQGTSKASPASGQLTLEVALPAGEFNARWFDTREGLTLISAHFVKGEEAYKLLVPSFPEDIVVAIHPTALARAKKEVTTAETNQVRVAKPNWLRRVFGAGTSSPASQPKPELARAEESSTPLPTPPIGANDATNPVTVPPAQIATPEPVPVTPPPAKTETAKATPATPSPATAETAEAVPATPPPAATETAKVAPATPPPAKAETGKATPATPPPAKVETAKAKSTAPPQVWIDPAYPPPSVVPSLGRTLIPSSRAATPPPAKPETVKAAPVTPPPAKAETAKVAPAMPPPAKPETAKAKSTAPPQVWIDPAYPPPSVVPSLGRTPIPSSRAATPPQARTQAVKMKAAASPPSRTEPAEAKSASVPRVWIDPNQPAAGVVVSPARKELPRPKAVTPPQGGTEPAKQGTVTPPPAESQTARRNSAVPPRVWVDPAFAPQAKPPLAAPSAPPQNTRQPTAPPPSGAPKAAASPEQTRVSPAAHPAVSSAGGPGLERREAAGTAQPWQGSVESPAAIRMDAWDLVLAGGGVPPKNLVESIAGGPAATGVSAGSAAALRTQLRFLGDFAKRFDLARMKQDKTLITGPLPAGMTARVLAEPGREYIVYIRPIGTQVRGGRRSGVGAHDRLTVLDLNLPAGRYTYEWLDPNRALPVGYQQLTHPGGVARLAAPAFRADAVLALRRQ